MKHKIISSNSVNYLIIISLMSKIMGFARDISLTFFWGADSVSDAFLISITIPVTICDLLIQAIAVGFIPTYTNIITNRNKNDGDEFTIGFIELLLACCLPILLIIIIKPAFILKIFASGFDIETNTIASVFIKITAISVMFKIVVSVLTGYLQSNNQYVIPAFIGIPYDIILIMGIIVSSFTNMMILPYSVIFAGLLQAVIMIFSAKRKGLKIHYTKDIFSDGTKNVIKLLLPLVVIVGANQLNVIVDRSFASYIQVGAITILDYANKICLMIENIVVFSIVAILYPELGKDAAMGDKKSFSNHLLFASDKILRYLIPTSVYVLILAKPIVSVLFGRGAFSEANVSDTAKCMSLYSIGIIFVALRTIYTRALYAINRVKDVTIISIISLVINIILNVLLSKLFGLMGLALATSVSNIVTTAYMFITLRKNNDNIQLIKQRSLLLSIGSSVILYLSYFLLNIIIPISHTSKIFYAVEVLIIGIILVCSVLYSDKLTTKER